MSAPVQFSEHNNHCLITMDDGKANALSFDMLEHINASLDKAAATGKVVILTGREGRFSAGFDLSIMSQGGETTMNLLRSGADIARRILNFDTPVILAITGHSMAMGALLMLCGDYRIGTAGDFKLGLNETAIGMPMPYFGTALGQYRLNKRYQHQAITLATIYAPEAAVSAGYLDEVVPASDLLERAEALANQYAMLDMNAFKISKGRMQERVNAELDTAFERELAAMG